MRLVAWTSLLALLVASPADACRVIDFRFTPTDGLQIVIWLEDAQGNYVDTIFITRTTGTYGLGNRPGRFDFNSEYLWPYGRRVTVFPVWAHRHTESYPKVIFQDEQDSDLSHAFDKSSIEPFYCRPMKPDEPTHVLEKSLDAGSCATVAFTDKGKFEVADPGGPDAGRSLYPPRADLVPVEGTDSSDVAKYADVNDMDAISHPTPLGNLETTISYSLPPELPPGPYVAYIETSQEMDQNQFYNYPSPIGIAYGSYGEAYRGQPSVVWKVPFQLDNSLHTETVSDYAGYGDPDGIDGNVREPDDTITADREGSGAQRLLVTSSGDAGMYRFRVDVKASDDQIPPGATGDLQATEIDWNKVDLGFDEPADDGTTGVAVSGYEVRYSIGAPMTEATFDQGLPANQAPRPDHPGAHATFELGGLMPQTHYWVGVRAHDHCLNNGPASIVDFVTPRAPNGEVSACFVATAAWGSPMAPKVSLLRGFRDRVLETWALGEIFVETYYTFGPGVAAFIRPSDPLRALARGALGPLVDLATP